MVHHRKMNKSDIQQQTQAQKLYSYYNMIGIEFGKVNMLHDKYIKGFMEGRYLTLGFFFFQ